MQNPDEAAERKQLRIPPGAQQEQVPAAVPAAYPLLLITIALIIHGSLYPWKFARLELSANSLVLLSRSWPKTIDASVLVDCVLNVFIYAPLGVLGFLALQQRAPKWLAAGGVLALGLTLSTCIELAQVFDKTRVSSLLDIVCNFGGTAVGVACGWILQTLLRLLVHRLGESPLFRVSGAIFLIAGWVSYQSFPFIPAISRTQLRLKLANLAAPSALSPVDTFMACAEWIALASLLEEVVGNRWDRKISAAMCLLIPAKLLIEERTFTWAEVAGVAIGVAILLLAASIPLVGRVRLAAGTMVVALMLNGLQPFHFSNIRAVFCWAPFQGFLESDAQNGMIVFLHKSFWYGATVWLLRKSGVRVTLAAAGTAVLLAAIETVQLWLPGRTAEVTDPVLALLLALSLWLADTNRSPGGQLHRIALPDSVP